MHYAAADGHYRATKFLLSEGAEITLTVDNMTFLDLALKNRHKSVCEVAVKSDRWMEILSVYSAAYPSPIFGLIEEFPDLCQYVMGRCISNNGESERSADYEVNFPEFLRFFHFSSTILPIAFAFLGEVRLQVT